MIYQRVSRLLMLTFAALASSSVCACAQTNMNPLSNNPLMGGGGTTPSVTVVAGNQLIYQLFTSDYDTWQYVGNPAPVNVADQKVEPRAVRIRSMSAYTCASLSYDPATNKSLWNVFGTAVTTPGTYTDQWVIKDLITIPVLVDPDLNMYQLVVVTPKPSPPAPAPPGPAPQPVPVKPTPPVRVVFFNVENISGLVNGVPGLTTTAMQNFIATGVFSPDVDDEISSIISWLISGQISDPDGELVQALIQYEADRGGITDDSVPTTNDN